VPAGTGAGNGKSADGKSGNGKVSKRDSDEIVADIERTRQNLALTIDTLADKVNPASQARRLREQATGQTRRIRDQASGQTQRLRDHASGQTQRFRDQASGQAQRFRDQAPGQLSRPEVQLAMAAVGLTVAGIIIYRIWGRRRT